MVAPLLGGGGMLLAPNWRCYCYTPGGMEVGAKPSGTPTGTKRGLGLLLNITDRPPWRGILRRKAGQRNAITGKPLAPRQSECVS